MADAGLEWHNTSHSIFKDIGQRMYSTPDTADPCRRKMNFCLITFIMSLGTVSNETKGQHKQNPSGTPFHRRTTLLKEKSKAPASLPWEKCTFWSTIFIVLHVSHMMVWQCLESRCSFVHYSLLRVPNSFCSKQLPVNWNTQWPCLTLSSQVTDIPSFIRTLLLHRRTSFITVLPWVT